VGGLAGLGVAQVAVARKPRVAILATGDEVVPPEEPAGPGQVHDVNSFTVAGLAQEAGGEPVLRGIIADDYTALLEAASRALSESEVLVLSAGSSVSVRDMTSAVIGELGRPGVLVHGVAVKPGKPTILAVSHGKPVLGLPGNPVSAMLIADLFLTPVLHYLLGCRNPPRREWLRARLSRNLDSEAGREDYVPARLEEREGELWAEPVFGKSNLIFTLINAHGVIRVPLNTSGLAQGEWADVRKF
jgi:molybdopterin molybdotransferase